VTAMIKINHNNSWWHQLTLAAGDIFDLKD